MPHGHCLAGARGRVLIRFLRLSEVKGQLERVRRCRSFFECFYESHILRRAATEVERQMANMKQIARMARVSLGTVSHVLNGTARVREPLRQRVEEAVQALGYQPSALARGLRRDKTNIIGMVIPDVTNPFFPAVVRGAEDVAFTNGYRLVLCNTDNDHVKELAHLNELRTFLPSGLIVIPSNFSDLTKQAESYHRSGAAVVCVDRLPKRWQGDSVNVANEHGAHSVTHHLIRLGHKRIAVITGPLHLTNSEQRLSGYQRAMAEAGLPVIPEYVQEASFDVSGGRAKGLLLLRLLPRPTAIFAANDMIAMGVIEAMRSLGLKCPEEISIAGFDDLEFAALLNPSLTSVFQPGYQLGATAARILLDRVNGDTGPARHIVLQTELKIRESVAPPPDLLPVSPSRKLTPSRARKTSRQKRPSQ
jgi:LacI family transcriptional regulator, galactose operon repressor